MKQKSVILNLNGSIDDCILLFKALFTKSIKVEAVVVSAGACSMDIATRNIRHILEKYNVELPVVEGETSLYDGKTIEVQKSEYSLGEYKYNLNKTYKTKLDYLEVLNNIISTRPVTIVSSGLCTNVARLINKCPQCVENIEKIVMLGSPINTDTPFVDPPTILPHYHMCDTSALKEIIKHDIKVIILPIDLTYSTFITPRGRYYLRNLNQTGLMLSEMLDKYSQDTNAPIVSPALLTCAVHPSTYKSKHCELDITDDIKYIPVSKSNINVINKYNFVKTRVSIFKSARKASTYEEATNE